MRQKCSVQYTGMDSFDFSSRSTWPQTKRFREISPNDNPGPGHYLLPPCLGNKSTFARNGIIGSPAKMKYIRIPRIPAPNEYGLQRPLSQGKKDFNNAACSRVFHKAIAQKVEARAQLPAPCDYQDSMPGPGTYQTDRFPEVQPHHEQRKPEKSRTRANNPKMINESTELPGPGSYNLRRDLITPRFMSTAPFLSNVPRWLPPNLPIGLGMGDMVPGAGMTVSCPGGKDAFVNPGPTAYNPVLPDHTSFHFKYDHIWI
ncbi:unnamed protein product [Echinostoma caproni]|uniref:Outer dense fiber protein 3-like n=1 Tax=Echinostoma caproni TaxID=27848 RepID=A0A183AP55_9TREM|nr:unnamed protein product [Echinostoma caproni]